MSGLIIPFFIQHQGCPHRCLFCDQHAVTGNVEATSENIQQQLTKTIEQWLGFRKDNHPVQLAFYGGSFTCLDEQVQQTLLQGAEPFLQDGSIESVRVSTRPDCLSPEICDYLRVHGVKTVEVGVQSMDDQVLQKVARGHRADDSVQAVKILKQSGLRVGVQLLPGLPGETTSSFGAGVKKVIGLEPDFVRLYPLLVLQGTGLADLYKHSRWRPLSLNRAITLVRKARAAFIECNIPVIRMGLQPSAELEQNLLAGPYHPAFGELVVSREWYLRAREVLSRNSGATAVTFVVSNRDCSAFLGPKRQNLQRLSHLFPYCMVTVECKNDLERNSLNYVVG
ncbi:MAG: radical SAM protein [Desulfobulbaceae bacterium]|nr:MAG: radical SAM protein [Desulfobulbaceae bacterium]